jgi:hypothetical protein
LLLLVVVVVVVVVGLGQACSQQLHCSIMLLQHDPDSPQHADHNRVSCRRHATAGAPAAAAAAVVCVGPSTAAAAALGPVAGPSPFTAAAGGCVQAWVINQHLQPHPELPKSSHLLECLALTARQLLLLLARRVVRCCLLLDCC